MTTTATRRHKWHYPQPPTPRILHLPSRSRRKHARAAARNTSGDRLEALFDEEREFTRTAAAATGDDVPVNIVLLENGRGDGGRRRDRVAECEESGSGTSSSKAAAAVRTEEEEEWRFQAEVLRAECNLLRMEKEIAVKKLERNRVGSDRTLRSAIHALISGRKKISEGKNYITSVIEEEIQNLVDKLKEIRKSSRLGNKDDDATVKTCSNFDEQASVLRRRLEKLGSMSEEKRMDKIREMAEESLSMNPNDHIDDDSSSPDASSIRQTNKGILYENELQGSRYCSGQCKVVVKRIVEQVRAETEQWSQMQEMLSQVRDEMEQLQSSRDFWEDRALQSDTRNHSLRSTAQEWRERALSAESKVTELQLKVSMLRDEIDTLRTRPTIESTRETPKLTLQIPKPHNETEKRVLKENRHEKPDRMYENSKQKNEVSVSSPGGDHNRRRKVHSCSNGDSGSSSRVLESKRSPLEEIGNSSRRSSRVVVPLSGQQVPFGRLLRESRF